MKIPGKNILRKEPFLLAHSLEVQAVGAGNSQGQGPELTGHLAAIVRKQGQMDSSAWLLLYF